MNPTMGGRVFDKKFVLREGEWHPARNLFYRVGGMHLVRNLFYGKGGYSVRNLFYRGRGLVFNKACVLPGRRGR